MNFTAVCSLTLSLKRTWKPTAPPSGTCSSSATRRATARAAIRRGWVQPIIPAAPRPAARHNLGSWVVLPEPVSPAITTTGCERINSTMRSASAAIGNPWSTSPRGNAAARASRATAEIRNADSNSARACASPGFAFHFDHSPSRRPRSRVHAPSMPRRALRGASRLDAALLSVSIGRMYPFE